jgi:tripartite ATP-independent transporter DctM subunit
MSFDFSVALSAILVLTLFGAPIAIALISGSILYLLVSGQDIGIAAQQVVGGLYDSYVAIAVPLFIFAAKVMNSGSITSRLLNFALNLVGHFRGGLAQVNIVTSVIFSGMSGSAVADTAGVGHVVTEMMQKDGRYPKGFACAVTVSSATIGPIIPPSIPMIFYALVSGSSLGALFLGGILPGLLIAGVLMILCAVISRRRGFPTEERVTDAARRAVLIGGILPLMMPVILLSGIYTGIFTPTEAAAVSGAYALLLSVVVYRDLGFRELYTLLVATARDTGVISILIGSAFLFNYVVSVERIPFALAGALQDVDLSRTMLLLIMNAVFLLLGCFLATSTIMLVCVPIVLPTVLAAGVDPVHFGVVIVINMMIGLITPPYGVLLFVIGGLTRTRVGEIVSELWVFIAVLIVALLIVTFVPGLVLWIPSMAGF